MYWSFSNINSNMFNNLLYVRMKCLWKKGYRDEMVIDIYDTLPALIVLRTIQKFGWIKENVLIKLHERCKRPNHVVTYTKDTLC